MDSGRAEPVPVRLDPFHARWSGHGQRQVENRNALPLTASNADGNNAIVFGDVDPDDLYLDSKDRRLEGQREVLFEHREEPGRLL